MKKTMKNATRANSAETIYVKSLWDTLTEAVTTFDSGDAVCSLGNAWCSISDLTRWLATQSAAQCTTRRYVTGVGQITEKATGDIVSHYATVEVIPTDVTVRRDETARVKRDQMTFLFALESLEFLQNAPGWDKMRRVQPVALSKDGMEFADI